MIPFRDQQGQALTLPPETVIRTGWDRTTARAMLPGESGIWEDRDGRLVHVFRLSANTRCVDLS